MIEREALRREVRSRPLGEAAGAVAAYGVQVRGEAREALVLRKGDTFAVSHEAALARAGVHSIVVAPLDSGDIGEDAAARRLAEAVAGPDL